jgi:CDP-4-dehydro-6-deoxyglucose reductase, E1
MWKGLNEMSSRADVIATAQQYFKEHVPNKRFIPGETYLPPSGKVIDSDDLVALVDSSLDMWLTAGRFARELETNLAQFLGVRASLLVNSGSSANLLAFAALTSPSLRDRRIVAGDEIITVAAGFPTTVNPCIIYGCVPVFVDIDIKTHNIDVSQLEAARSPKTKAVMIAHTLGNPFNAVAVKEFCETHGLWFIEDNCDALGAKYNGQLTGTFGDIATESFYPAHHMTMGEGGAVFTNSLRLKTLLLRFRDWGRDCYCEPGVDNTCGRRFDQDFKNLPKGFDHKYVYSEIGYNLKITDMQAAIGLSQLKKLPGFIAARQKNHQYLDSLLQNLQDRVHLPEATINSQPSWFGYTLTLKPESKVRRIDFQQYLEKKKVGTRLVFGGNLLKQPAYEGIAKRVIGDLANTERVLHDSLWVGIHPQFGEEEIQYIAQTIKSGLDECRN